MRRLLRNACVLALLFNYPAAVPAWSTLENWADVLLLQMRAKQPLPALSSYGAELPLADAYAVQRILVKELATQSPLVGFKAELTTPMSRVKMRAAAPVFTAVLKRDLLMRDSDLGPARPGEHSIAPAIGYVVKRRIEAPIANPAVLPGLIARAVPVVMVLDPGFENRSAVRAEDLVAANGAHTHLVVGKDFPDTTPAAADSVLVEVLHEGNVIDRAKGTNIMGSQVKALLWLVNEIVARGQVVVPGQVLVTGPLSEPMPISPGNYVVKYWDHDEIPLRLRAPGT
jgi:2-oxo-3-hexenedioate decarboxylase